MSALSDKKKNNRNSIQPDGQYLRQLRAKIGLTQVELAFRLEVSERLVRKAEKGGRIDCSSLLLFIMFYQQQGLRIDAEKFGSLLTLSTKEIAISFFRDCFVLGNENYVARWCAAHVSGSIDGQRSAGQLDAIALIESFLAEFEQGAKWTIGQVVSDSETASVFWTRESVFDHGKTRREQGVALIIAQTSVTAFDVFTFKSPAPP